MGVQMPVNSTKCAHIITTVNKLNAPGAQNIAVNVSNWVVVRTACWGWMWCVFCHWGGEWRLHVRACERGGGIGCVCWGGWMCVCWGLCVYMGRVVYMHMFRTTHSIWW